MTRDVVRKTNLIRYTDKSGAQQTLPNTPRNYLKAKQYQFFEDKQLSADTDPFKTLPTECSESKESVRIWYDTKSHFSYLRTPTETVPILPSVFEDHLEEVIRYIENDSFTAHDFGTTYKQYNLTTSQAESIINKINSNTQQLTVSENSKPMKFTLEKPDQTYTIYSTGYTITDSDSLVIQTPPYSVPPKETTENITLDSEAQHYYSILGRIYALSQFSTEKIHTISL